MSRTFRFPLAPEQHLVWQPLPPRPGLIISPQQFAITSPEREIAFITSRGPGKTQSLFVFLLRLAIARDDQGALLYPNYRGLLLRRYAKDLEPTLDDAEKLYEPFGAKKIGRPAVFEFAGGPKIFTDHLENESSWRHRQGHEYHKIGIEEVNQIESEELYLLVLGSLRLSPDGNSQAMLTGNWGDVGDIWLKRRFVKVPKAGGGFCQPNKTIRDPVSGRTRIYITGLPEDNPLLGEKDPGYLQFLETLPEPKRSAWRWGNPDAYAGQFFGEWRPNGPLEGDPRNANHVISGVTLPYWCHRWGSMDWGRSHYGAAYKFCSTRDGRLHVYGEKVERSRGSFLWGVELAKWWLADLRALPDQRITLHLSRDAFAVRDEGNTIAERIAMGMDAVFGSESTYLAQPTEKERQIALDNPRLAADMMRSRATTCQSRLGINLEPALSEPGSRANIAEYVRELMRFQKFDTGITFDGDYARSLLNHPGDGEKLYQEYMAKFVEAEPEVLPKLQIWRHACPIIIDLIPVLKPDPLNPRAVAKFDATEFDMGDDPWDALGYGLIVHQDFQDRPPREHVVGKKLEKARAQGIHDPTVLSQIAMFAQKNYDETDDHLTGSIRFGRAAVPEELRKPQRS